MRLSFLALAGLLVATAPRAQVYQGLVDLGGSASIYSVEGTTVLQFSPAGGYFFTDALEAGVRLDYVKVEDNDGNGNLFVFGAYHFGRNGATTVPFLEANLGTNLTGDSDLVFGGRGGAKVFFLPGGALTAAGFLSTTGEVTTVGAQAGVSIFL
jgi:hypothetical protein